VRWGSDIGCPGAAPDRPTGRTIPCYETDRWSSAVEVAILWSVRLIAAGRLGTAIAAEVRQVELSQESAMVTRVPQRATPGGLESEDRETQSVTALLHRLTHELATLFRQ
jgi:hypothetical protein